jgi:hypothetical protein
VWDGKSEREYYVLVYEHGKKMRPIETSKNGGEIKENNE